MFEVVGQSSRIKKKPICGICTGKSTGATDQSTGDLPGSVTQVLRMDQSTGAHSQSTDGPTESWAVD